MAKKIRKPRLDPEVRAYLSSSEFKKAAARDPFLKWISKQPLAGLKMPKEDRGSLYDRH